MLFSIDFVDHEEDSFLGFAKYACQLLIDRRQAVLCIDNEKEKIALAQRFLCGATHLRTQFIPRLRDRHPAGVPQRERALAASANRRNPITCDSGLIMNDGNLPADQTIEQRGLTYVWPPDDCDIGHVESTFLPMF